MALNKTVPSAAAAVADIPDGARILLGNRGELHRLDVGHDVGGRRDGAAGAVGHEMQPHAERIAVLASRVARLVELRAELQELRAQREG